MATISPAKVALVTGASSGMGKETAKRLLQEGLAVYVAARRRPNGMLRALGAIPLKMDITVDEDVLAAVKQIQSGHGGIDALVNNAGFGMYGAMEESTIDDARYQFEVNLFGMARLTQLALPAMRKKGAGTIVNISSMGGKIYTPLGSWYHATKHAVQGWSDCLRIELAPFGIQVVIIEPEPSPQSGATSCWTNAQALRQRPLPGIGAGHGQSHAQFVRQSRCCVAPVGGGRCHTASGACAPSQDTLCGGQVGQTADVHSQILWRPGV